MDDNNKHASHSLDADLATGWRPRLKIIGPMPLNFDNEHIDRLLKPVLSSDTSLYEVVYLGPRPRDTFEMHSAFTHDYRYKYRHLLSADYEHLRPFFKKFYSQFEPESKRPFVGMKESAKSSVIFESRFESGNLDCALRTRKNQFDLFLRIDSNTAGHVMWYYFAVANSLKQERTIRLNIVNLRNSKAMHDHSLVPYVKRKGQWAQGGSNVTITTDKIDLRAAMTFFNSDQLYDSQYYRKLSFDLHLQASESVQIAYSIPYTYSNLLKDIQAYRCLASKLPGVEFKVTHKNQSLSGLDIPYIQITHEQEEKSEKKLKKLAVLVLGRQHPGESNGSHVLHGFLHQLLSSQQNEMVQLRRHCDFHVVPMVNPDGVVLGNFRTSLFGKDLNRLFKKTMTLMIPEVQFVRNLAFELSKNYKKRLFMFLDFHGHSARKNAFCYAPGFFQTSGLEDIRQFPKIIANKCEVFRYPSCSFRIPTQKKTTARAVFSKFIGLCYTIETSNWAYMRRKDRVCVAFNASKWQKFGSDFSRSMGEFMCLLTERRLKRLKGPEGEGGGYSKGKRIESKKTIKKDFHLRTQESQKIYQTNSIKVTPKNMLSISHQIEPLSDKHVRGKSISYDGVLRKKNTERQRSIQEEEEKEQRISEEKEEGGDEGREDEGEDSDGSEEENMQDSKFKKYIMGAAKMFIQFEKAYYGESYDSKSKLQLNFKQKKKNNRSFVQQQACLRNQSESKNVSLAAQKRKKQIPDLNDRRYEVMEHYERRVRKIEGLGFRSNAKESNSQQEGAIRQSQMVREGDGKIRQKISQVSSSQLMSLPRISVINYLAYDESNEREPPVFKVPKIDSLMTIRANGKRY